MYTDVTCQASSSLTIFANKLITAKQRQYVEEAIWRGKQKLPSAFHTMISNFNDGLMVLEARPQAGANTTQ